MPEQTPPLIAVEPGSGRAESLRAAVVEGGGVLAAVEDADALVWADAARADLMPDLLARGP